MERPVIVIGAGGHAKVLIEVLQRLGREILGLTDPIRHQLDGLLLAHPLLGDDEMILKYPAETVDLVNGLGTVGGDRTRHEVYQRFHQLGYHFATVVHPTAIVAAGAALGEGVQILAGAVVGPDASLEDNVLINTRSVVEHDCVVAGHAHVATGAVLCGGCRLGAGVHVGAGAVVNQGVSVGGGAVIASGSVVRVDVESRTLVAGVPARFKKAIP